MCISECTSYTAVLKCCLNVRQTEEIFPAPSKACRDGDVSGDGVGAVRPIHDVQLSLSCLSDTGAPHTACLKDGLTRDD